MMIALPQAYAAFVNLGDNCEFGFAQRAHGIEEGSLLRWAVTPAEALLKALRNKFEGLYAFDNLSPSSPDMVRDSATGLCFHTQMFSEMTSHGLKFKGSDAERQHIYKNEIEKISYMKQKLINQFEGASKIFVMKSNSGINEIIIKYIVEALVEFNERNILVVVSSCDQNCLSVESVSRNFYQATISRFAPYEKADSIDLEAWNYIVGEMVKRPDVRAERFIDTL